MKTLVRFTHSRNRRPASRIATHPNREGAPSYRRSLREQIVQVLTTGTLSNTFYASREQIAQEAVEVLTRGRQECPQFLARALVYARNEGLIKDLPVMGLAILSGGGGATRRLFEQAFGQVVLIPDDLRNFVKFCKSGKIPGRQGLGGMTVGKVRESLLAMSEYHAVKYGSANSREITLGDIARLAHPKPGSAAVSERLGWLVKGREALSDNPELNPKIRALEALKLAATEDEQVALIREGGLPYEVVIPSVKATTAKIWEALLRHAPYMNLLRNLNTFARNGVFRQDENVRYAVSRLTDRHAIERSKVLPFRFFDAWKACCASANDSRLTDALRQALELSFANMPTLGSRQVAIGTDVSGSMRARFSEKSSARYIDIAGIFTGALLKRIEGRALPILFDDRVHLDHGLSARDDIVITAEKIARYGGGATAVGAPIQYLLDRQIKVDAFIGITDNIDWAYGDGCYASGDFLSLWRRYRKEVNPEAMALLVTIAPYRDTVAPAGEKGVRFIYGWSDRVLKYIALSLEQGESQIQAIERLSLSDLWHPQGQPRDDDSDNAQMED